MDKIRLTEQLLQHEGYRRFPYTDSVGVLTVGIGRNLEHKGVRRDEALYMLNNDMDEVFRDLDMSLPWWRSLPDDHQHVLADMCFNLGLTGLLGFKRMIEALRLGQYAVARTEMLNSLWASQVGKRARTLAEMVYPRIA